ncbi:hypothetical protein [uncultured Microbacterium sp.]|uniref:hypothetical protein n=1 Tax=uncultured Microbacterium sp. TaxID=191216 RepID=UPI0028DBA728|nr:hypothetical protein [uncultured Microbacterium sp.]
MPSRGLSPTATLSVTLEDENNATLCAARRTLPDFDEWIALGRFRRGMRAHSTPSHDHLVVLS